VTLKCKHHIFNQSIKEASMHAESGCQHWIQFYNNLYIRSGTYIKVNFLLLKFSYTKYLVQLKSFLAESLHSSKWNRWEWILKAVPWCFVSSWNWINQGLSSLLKGALLWLRAVFCCIVDQFTVTFKKKWTQSEIF
jgi:hypothetical protein